MCKALSTILGLLLSAGLLSQQVQEPLSIDEIREGEDFTFPLVSGSNQNAVFKINSHMQLAELELLKGAEQASVFERVRFDKENVYGAKVYMHYETLINQKHLIGIRFNESSCGATCAYWLRYYNFNPGNGDRYFLQDFVDSLGLSEFKTIIANHRTSKLLQQTREMGMPDSSDFVMSTRGTIQEDDLFDFYFTEDSIFLDNFNLIHKHDKHLDLNHITGIAISDIAHLLNEFGRAVLVKQEGTESFKSSTQPQLYQGFIDGKYEFLLLFKPYWQNELLGLYAYKEYGQGIHLKGVQEDGIITLEEDDSLTEQKDVLSFKMTQNTISGYWSKADSPKRVLSAKN